MCIVNPFYLHSSQKLVSENSLAVLQAMQGEKFGGNFAGSFGPQMKSNPCCT